jgi:hypothetical protein
MLTLPQAITFKGHTYPVPSTEQIEEWVIDSVAKRRKAIASSRTIRIAGYPCFI